MSRARLVSAWVNVRDDILHFVKEQGVPDDAVDWIRKSLDYNVGGGKLNRGLTVLDTFEILRDGQPVSDNNLSQALVLGWCVELFQSYSLVADDIMDRSVTRRGQPCWYRVANVGPLAINDVFIITSIVPRLLKKYLQSEPCFHHIVALFDDINLKTGLGQLLDMLTAPGEHVDLSRFSSTRQNLIFMYKTSFYTFYLPIAIGMRLAGVTSPSDMTVLGNMPIPSTIEPIAKLYQKRLDSFLSIYNSASSSYLLSHPSFLLLAVQYVLLLIYGFYAAFHVISGLTTIVTDQATTLIYSSSRPLLKMLRSSHLPTNSSRSGGLIDHYQHAMTISLSIGEYFQSHDDFLDCFAPPEHLGKVGTDIVDNKCSWCINTALKFATVEQRRVLDENYGRKDAKAEASVKVVFSAPNIDLAKRFSEYEADSYKRIRTMIAAVPEVGGMKREVYLSALKKVYKRTK